MNRKALQLFSSSALALTMTAGLASAQGIIYVDASASTNGGGTDWTDPYDNLEDALAEVAGRADHPNLRTIFVARGTYKPTSLPTGSTDPRDASFRLPTNTQLYGGFINGETLQNRSEKFRETILSGDIGTAMVRSDNAYSVVTIEPGASTPTRVDGFSIQDGQADDATGNGAGSDLLFSRGHGGGIYCYDATLRLRNCFFQANLARYDGGAVYFLSPADNNKPQVESLRVFNCFFFSNIATRRGGGLFALGMSPITEGGVDIPSYVYHSTFQRNFAGNRTAAATPDDGGAGVFIGPGASATVELATVPLTQTTGLPANFVLANSQFFDNGVYGGGAALRIDVGDKYLVSNTIAYNQVLGNASGPNSTMPACSLFVEGHGVGYMVGSIAYDTVDSSGALNTVDAIGGPAVVTGSAPSSPRFEASESDIFVTGPGVYWTPPSFPAARQNIDVAPGFQSVPGRNFRLSVSSPLVDRALDQLILPPDYPDADKDNDVTERVPKILYLLPGQVRVVDEGVPGPAGQLLDLGAFERQ